jgi:hypothetical protein
MTPLVRRSLAVMTAALLAGVFALIGTSAPASAAAKGSLKIVSVTNVDNPDLDTLLVQNQSFAVKVTVVDNAGQPTTVSRATTVVLEEVSGPGDLIGTTQTLQAVIPRDGSDATISPPPIGGAKYSQYANDVVLRVRVKSGVDLLPADVSVDFALTAVSDGATPGTALDLKDKNCGAPTSAKPTCGRLLLPNGAGSDQLVVMSVGSCAGLGLDGTTPCADGVVKALVVTALADLSIKKPDGTDYYTKTSPATMILACDKDLCHETANGVPKITVIYELSAAPGTWKPAGPCPAKGVLDASQDVCVDNVQSSRQQGDLYTYVLFDRDIRFSYP